MNLVIIILAALTFLVTLIGGLVTLKFKKSLPYFFAFAAGSLIAVAFLDILPESVEIAEILSFPLEYVMGIAVISFFAYNLIDRFFVTHCVGDECHKHGHIFGPIGASSIIIHSFLDGAVIGTAFLVNSSIGLTVALAILFHNFTDGINTVTVMLKNKQKTKKTIGFLLLDAIAPVLGVLFISFINLPLIAILIILAIFMGMFIYLGAASLLPESKEHASKKTIFAMALGILIIMALTLII